MEDKIKQFKELSKQLSALLDKTKIKEFFEQYKDSKKPFIVYIQSYTPSFNDGDPCENSTYICVGPQEIINNISVDDETMFQDKNLTEQDLTITPLFSHETLSEDEMLFLEEVYTRRYGTNYHMLIICHKGNIDISEDYYYCDY